MKIYDVLPKLRIIYNNEVMNILRKREIKDLIDKAKVISTSYNKKIKSKIKLGKKFKKRDLKRMSISAALSIVNGPKNAVKEREKQVTNIEKEIDLISKISFWEYLEHMKGNEKEELKKMMQKINQLILFQQ